MTRAMLALPATLSMLLGVAPALAAPAPQHAQTVTRTVTGAVHAVHVRADLGRVAVVAGTEARVVAHEAWNYQQPTLEVTLEGGVLTVTASCDTGTQAGPTRLDTGNTANQCADDLEVTVPADVALTASSDAGDVHTAGIHGKERLSSGAGRIVIEDARGSVSAYADAGAVEATRVAGRSIALRSGADRVTLQDAKAHAVTLTSDGGPVSATALAADRVVAHSDAGAVAVVDSAAPTSLAATAAGGPVSVAVPAGTYAVTAHSDAGRVIVTGIRNDQQAQRSVTARSDSDRVIVRGR